LGYIYLLLDRYQEALPPLIEALRLEPTSILYERVSAVYLMLNRLDEARMIIQEAQARKIDSPSFDYHLYLIACRQKDTAGMAAHESAVRRIVGGKLALDQNTSRGRLSFLRASLRRNGIPPSVKILGARFLALVGYDDEAKIAAMSPTNTSMDWNEPGNAAVTLALAGDLAGAQKLGTELNQHFPEATSVRFCFLPSVRAATALSQGKPQQAVECLVAAAPYEMMHNMIAVYIRGEAYLAAHQGAEAAAEFQKMLDHPSVEFDLLRNVLPHLGLGRAYALKGDTAKARASYKEFLILWKDADPDIPILKQAKAEYDAIQKKELP